MFFKNLVFLLLLSYSLADESANDRTDFKKSLSRDCASAYSLTCFKLDLVSWVDKLSEQNDFSLVQGVSVVRESSGARSNTADIVAELARDFPNDPEARLDVYLLKKVENFLSTHSLKLDLWNKNNDVEARGGGEGGGGGGGGKKGGGGMYLLAAGAMMKATLAAIALKGLALLAAKALMTAVISLLISGIIGLKSLTHHHHGHQTVEVHGHHHDDHDRYSPYKRSFEQVPLPLGLRDSYQPPK